MPERTKDMIKVGETTVRNSGGDGTMTSLPKQLEMKAGSKLIFWRNSKSGKNALIEYIPAEGE